MASSTGTNNGGGEDKDKPQSIEIRRQNMNIACKISLVNLRHRSSIDSLDKKDLNVFDVFQMNLTFFFFANSFFVFSFMKQIMQISRNK